jgi:hypothetical protein
MSKLKNIIKQLTTKDYTAIYESLINSNAEKSAYLLKFMREKHLSDAKIMDELEVNTNAYYTLRSRLNQKIEEYLVQQMESPRTSLIKKVATIHEIIFTKKKAIAIATLKKLEKELLDYDLSNELTIVYKTLKKLLIYTPEDLFTYSQAYNKHVAYMLALDKAEDLLGSYFKKYGEYYLSHEETDLIGLKLIRDELNNVSNLYQSHRLYVYQSFVNCFHTLVIDKNPNPEFENTFEKIQSIFDSYYLDANYYHLILVLEYLRIEYYLATDELSKLEKALEDINESVPVLVSNYYLFTFSPRILLIKQLYAMKSNTDKLLYEENKALFEDYDVNKNNIPEYVIYSMYRITACYYMGKYEEASKLINQLLNDTTLKKFPKTLIEIKLFLALQYAIVKDADLFNQLINSIQRQIRMMGKDDCKHAVVLTKLLKAAFQDNSKAKKLKLQSLIERLLPLLPSYYTPFKYIRLDSNLVDVLCER